MNHEDTKTRSKEFFKKTKDFWFPSCLAPFLPVAREPGPCRPLYRFYGEAARVFVVMLTPAVVAACPRCFDATPYRTGLLWAVVLLMPVPFILAGLLVRWIIRNSKGDFPPY